MSALINNKNTCIAHHINRIFAFTIVALPILIFPIIYMLGYYGFISTSNPLGRELYFYLGGVKFPIFKSIPIVLAIFLFVPTFYPIGLQALFGKHCCVEIIGSDIFVNGSKAMAIVDLQSYDIVTKIKNFRKSKMLYLYKNDGTFVSCYFAFQETDETFRQNMDTVLSEREGLR